MVSLANRCTLISHAPSHGTREVLIIYGALLSSDPGDIHDTIAALIKDRIRVSIIGLSAQVAICAELCSKTNAGDESTYAVALHEQHFKEVLLAATTPPVTLKGTNPRDDPANQASLLMMGFPSRKLEPEGKLTACACHNKESREGYSCTRCLAKVCRLPTECPVCGLTLILSTHLARSYHHLFPLKNWVEVSWDEAEKVGSVACLACQAPFPPLSVRAARGKGKGKATAMGVIPASETKGVSESGRYACQVCGNHFCIDCDVFCHEVVHNCPGCLSDTRPKQGDDQNDDGEKMDGLETQVVTAMGATGLGGDTVVRDTVGMDVATRREPDDILGP
jgi:transcription initiation factor TFIIH subunit 2